MVLQDYILDHQNFDWNTFLQNWTWLLPKEFSIWMVNRFGDLIIILDDGTVHLVDIGVGEMKKIADNRNDFEAKIDGEDNANDWLMIPLVDQLVASRILLNENQCYGFKQPLILGGDYAINNVAVISVGDYYGGYGSIHKQIEGLPDGTAVQIKVQSPEVE
jgi:hypothetical protein